MKRIALTLFATTLATTAIAGSDRTNDLRPGSSTDLSVTGNAASEPMAPALTLSSKGKKTPYAYLNPYGVGPNNDSR